MLAVVSFTPILVLLSVLLYAKHTNENLLKKFVSNYIVFAGFWFWGGHTFAPDMVAKSIGWPAGSPFQKEVAFANLSFAIAALYVSRNNNQSIDAYKAVAVGYAAWLVGTFIVHMEDLIRTRNFSVNNAFAAPLIAVITIVTTIMLVK